MEYNELIFKILIIFLREIDMDAQLIIQMKDKKTGILNSKVK